MTSLGFQQHRTMQHGGTDLRSETPAAQMGTQPTPGPTRSFATRLHAGPRGCENRTAVRLTERAEHPRKEPAQRPEPADALMHEGFVSRDEAQMNLSISAATEAGAQRGKRSGRGACKEVSNMSSTGQQSGTDKAISFSREVVHGQQELKHHCAPTPEASPQISGSQGRRAARAAGAAQHGASASSRGGTEPSRAARTVPLGCGGWARAKAPALSPGGDGLRIP